MTSRTSANYHRWTREELDTLALHWPRGGLRAVSPHLPHLGADALRGKACDLGIHVAGRQPHRRQPTSELIDSAIRRDYRNGRPNLRALALATGRHVGWLKWRAAVLGIASGARRRNPPWTEAENLVVTDGIERGHSAVAIRNALKRAGSLRSLDAILSRVHFLGLRWNREWWTATDVARLFNVDPSVVFRWISQGMLVAKREPGPSQTASGQATYWQIGEKAVVAFMLGHPEQWDHRKMRKEVLLDLLKPGRFSREVAAA
jgi:hypothetical protein